MSMACTARDIGSNAALILVISSRSQAVILVFAAVSSKPNSSIFRSPLSMAIGPSPSGARVALPEVDSFPERIRTGTAWPM